MLPAIVFMRACFRVLRALRIKMAHFDRFGRGASGPGYNEPGERALRSIFSEFSQKI